MTASPDSTLTDRSAVTLRRIPASELHHHRAALAELAAQAVESNPFFEPWCLLPAIEFLPEARAAEIVLVSRGETLIGMLPVEPAFGYAHLPVAYLRTAMHRHCFQGTPLVRQGEEHAFFQAVLNTGKTGHAAFIQFRQMVGDGPLESTLAALSGTSAYKSGERLRACLNSDLSYEDYILEHIRGKKRKEWRRLTNRLAEEGVPGYRLLTDKDDLPDWCEAFLALENEGWRGHGGSSLLAEDGGADYLAAALAGALDAGRLYFLRLDLDGRPVAMLINFAVGDTGWSFKIAHDPALARFSPGVMIELELTRRALDEKRFALIDSCAQENHPMIDRLWAERRRLNSWNVPMPHRGARAITRLCRTLESTSMKARGRTDPKGIKT